MNIDSLIERLNKKIKNSITFRKKDEKILLIYYKNESYKRFLTNQILHFCNENKLEIFDVSPYKCDIVNSCHLYKESDFYLNMFYEIKISKKAEYNNIVVFKDIDSFISDDKTIGLVEYINDFKRSINDNTKFIIVMTNKRQIMKPFCKSDPSFLGIDFYGCLTEAAFFDVSKKTPEESLKELTQDENKLGEINED
jgi:hypothetical protein